MENLKKKTLRLDKDEISFLYDLLTSSEACDFRRKWYKSELFPFKLQNKVYHAYTRFNYEED